MQVVRSLLDDGSDATSKNKFRNDPRALATCDDCRKALDEMVGKPPPTEEERKRRHEENLKAYKAIHDALQDAVDAPPCGETASDLRDAANALADALSKARAACVAEPLVNRGAAALAGLEARAALREQVDAVRAAAPVVSQRAYVGRAKSSSDGIAADRPSMNRGDAAAVTWIFL